MSDKIRVQGLGVFDTSYFLQKITKFGESTLYPTINSYPLLMSTKTNYQKVVVVSLIKIEVPVLMESTV